MVTKQDIEKVCQNIDTHYDHLTPMADKENGTFLLFVYLDDKTQNQHSIKQTLEHDTIHGYTLTHQPQYSDDGYLAFTLT